MQLGVILEAEVPQQVKREPPKARAGRNQNMSFVHASLENVAQSLVQINESRRIGSRFGSRFNFATLE